jgi:spermidine synthase
MIPWQELDRATVPGGGAPLVLTRRGSEFVIRLGTEMLMGSRAHGSEEALAELVCERIGTRPGARVLIGGLGMGFTLAAALRPLSSDAQVLIAELIPAVVAWNRGPLADLAGRPLEDPRVRVIEGDVAASMRATAAFDAIILDVDNGPDGMTRRSNDRLYSSAGLARASDALRDSGVIGVWSAAPDRDFTRRLGAAGFEVEEKIVRARVKKGGRHTLWLGTKNK